MKKLVFAAAAAMLMSGMANAQDVLKMGTEGAYPPFNAFNEKKELVGFDIEIGNALCEQMKRKCEWVTNEWDTIIPALNAKKFDTILAQMAIREDRAKIVDFTKPYSNTPSTLVGKKGHGLEQSEAGLKGKKLGAQRETQQEQWLKEKYGKVAEIVSYGTLDEAVADIGVRIDGVLSDGPTLDEYIAKAPGKYEQIGAAIQMPSPGAAIAVRKGEDKLREDINKALEAIMANGTYDKISAKYFTYPVKPKM